MGAEVEEDGFPPAPRCPECGAFLVPEPIAADRIIIVWRCTSHGIINAADPFESV